MMYIFKNILYTSEKDFKKNFLLNFSPAIFDKTLTFFVSNIKLILLSKSRESVIAAAAATL